jgi:hypothetical protein
MTADSSNPRSRRPAELPKSVQCELVRVEHVLDVEKENLVETHLPLRRGDRVVRLVRVPYFASSASTLAFLSTKRSRASRLRVRASFCLGGAGSRRWPL